MQARSKLAEAEHFLGELKRTVMNPEQFRYNFSAFLSAAYSVMDFLLYDFAEEHELGFTRKDQIGWRDVWAASTGKGYPMGLDFVKWWRGKVDSLWSDALWGKRHEVTHRGYPDIDIDYPSLLSGMVLSGLVNSLLTSGIITASQVEVGTPPRANPTTGRPLVALAGTPHVDLRDQCDRLYHKMKALLSEAEDAFWA